MHCRQKARSNFPAKGSCQRETFFSLHDEGPSLKTLNVAFRIPAVHQAFIFQRTRQSVNKLNIFTFGKCFVKRNIVCFPRYIIKVVTPAFSKYMSLARCLFSFKHCTSEVYQIVSIKFSKLHFIHSEIVLFIMNSANNNIQRRCQHYNHACL